MNQREEKLLREFVRREMVKPILEQRRKEERVRIWVRGLIKEAQEENYLSTLFEAKDMANPHPNTGINKLRDAIRKAKPSIKAKYQQLTTDGAQRESFTNHFLTAMVRLFDELDALNAKVKKQRMLQVNLIQLVVEILISKLLQKIKHLMKWLMILKLDWMILSLCKNL